jgi:putative Holliday junction resolvase
MDNDSKSQISKSSGRILALDLGDKRIGVAVSDLTRSIARPLTVILRKSRRADFEKIIRLVGEQKVQLVIVGLPTLPSGEEGSRAKWTNDYAHDLAGHVGVRVQLWDESFSTVDAHEILRLQGKDPRRHRDRIDAIAAAVILQSYLRSQNGAD